MHASSARLARADRAVVAHVRFCGFALIGAASVLLLGIFLAGGGQEGVPRLFDFHTFWVAGRAYVHGDNPYPARIQGPIGRADWFVYPAPIAALFAPFGLLPYAVAWPTFAALLVVATVGALWLVGVRDWRCYAVAFCCLPVLKAINLGTATPLLMLGVAAVWRFRDRAGMAAGVAALTVLTKLFLWPLVIWLWWTSRRRTALLAAALGALALIVGWLPLGTQTTKHYVTLMHQLSVAEARDGYGIGGIASALGASPSMAALSPLLCAPLVLLGLRPIAHRVNERASFAIFVAASVALSPIVWQHYFAFAILVLALVSPRLTTAWLLPMGYWALTQQQAWSSLWRPALGLALLAACVVDHRPLRRRSGLRPISLVEPSLNGRGRST